MSLRNKSVNHYAAAYVAGVCVGGGGEGQGHVCDHEANKHTRGH